MGEHLTIKKYKLSTIKREGLKLGILWLARSDIYLGFIFFFIVCNCRKNSSSCDGLGRSNNSISLFYHFHYSVDEIINIWLVFSFFITSATIIFFIRNETLVFVSQLQQLISIFGDHYGNIIPTKFKQLRRPFFRKIHRSIQIGLNVITLVVLLSPFLRKKDTKIIE